MLPRRFKFKLRAETEFFKNVERSFSQYFTVFHQNNNEKLKLAVVVPKKVAHLATERNNLKRVLYSEAIPFLKEKETLPLSLVVVAKPSIKQLSQKELVNELGQALKKVL